MVNFQIESLAVSLKFSWTFFCFNNKSSKIVKMFNYSLNSQLLKFKSIIVQIYIFWIWYKFHNLQLFHFKMKASIVEKNVIDNVPSRIVLNKFIKNSTNSNYVYFKFEALKLVWFLFRIFKNVQFGNESFNSQIVNFGSIILFKFIF